MIIGVIGAFDEEVEKFIEMFSLELKEDKIWTIYTGKFQDKKLVVCRSGIGKVNSGAMTQYLISNYHVDLIINSFYVIITYFWYQGFSCFILFLI